MKLPLRLTWRWTLFPALLLWSAATWPAAAQSCGGVQSSGDATACVGDVVGIGAQADPCCCNEHSGESGCPVTLSVTGPGRLFDVGATSCAAYGSIEATAPGTITVTATDCCGNQASLTVTVCPPSCDDPEPLVDTYYECDHTGNEGGLCGVADPPYNTGLLVNSLDTETCAFHADSACPGNCNLMENLIGESEIVQKLYGVSYCYSVTYIDYTVWHTIYWACPGNYCADEPIYVACKETGCDPNQIYLGLDFRFDKKEPCY